MGNKLTTDLHTCLSKAGMSTDKILYPGITEKIIKGFYIVYNTLDHGFLENVYEIAFTIELRKVELHAEQPIIK